jgi:hypothetical protein
MGAELVLRCSCRLQVADALMFGAGYAAFGGSASLHNNQGYARNLVLEIK